MVNVSVWLPIVLATLGAFGAFIWRSGIFGAKIVELLTVLKEKVSICQVGIEALRIVDSDSDIRADILERRIDDIERWLQLTSQENPHPFVIRYQSARPRLKE